MEMRAIIMAAGKGTRLKSELPKVLHPLFGKPLLVRVLEALQTLSLQGLSIPKVYVIVGHGREAVQAELAKKSYPFTLTPVVQEPQLGTGHAVQQVKPVIEADYSGDVLILSGDVPLLTQTSLEQLLQAHRQSGHALTVLTARLDNPTGYGRVIRQGERLEKIVEERDASLAEKAVEFVNTGIYCLNWQAISPLLDRLSAENAQGEFYLTDVIGLAVAQGLPVGSVDLADAQEMLGVNSRVDLALCHQVLNQRSQAALMAQGVTILDPAQTMIAPEVQIGPDSVVYPGCFLQGDIQIGACATIGPHTTLMGRVEIGENSTVIQSLVKDSRIGAESWIGPFAHLRDGADISHHVKIGNFVEVKNTQVGHHSNAAHLAYLGDATLGVDVNMGAGTITANYDPIRDLKHQTVLEDGVKVGCNAVLVAPVTVGHHASVAAGSVITKDVAPWDLAIARPKQTEIPQWVAKVQGSASPNPL